MAQWSYFKIVRGEKQMMQRALGKNYESWPIEAFYKHLRTI